MQVKLSAEEIRELEEGNIDPPLSTILFIARKLDVQPGDLMVPSGGSDPQYYAYRCYLLKKISALSKKDLKRAIEMLNGLLKEPCMKDWPSSRLPQEGE